MANISGQLMIAPQELDKISTTQELPLRARAMDKDGNEYIYLKGVADTAVGRFVTFDEAGITALLAANAKGSVATAMAATVADRYGWYQIYGSGIGSLAANCADNADLYATATAGVADDAIVAGDRIKGALARGAVTDAANAAVQLNYPFIDDMAD
jgi:hypothetical protein